MEIMTIKEDTLSASRFMSPASTAVTEYQLEPFS